MRKAVVVQVVRRSGDEVTVEVTVRLSGSLLEMEGAILEASNAVGRCATEEALGRFDTDGSPMRVGETKLTARGRNPKVYQSPYGEVQVERYVYQTSRGGRIYCPLEHQARIIRGATPRFASQLSHKYAQLNVRAVQRDLEQNHGRKVAASYIQNVAEYVGSIATAKEETWEYALPPLDVPIAAIVISLDGAMIPMADSAGYREAMAGALSFYDHDGERQHTVYLAAAPEYGKQTFLARLEREIARAKQSYPNALYLGIADGAYGNWTFLEQHTQRQLIDFFHATQYIGKLAQAQYPQRRDAQRRADWQHTRCHTLKHDPEALDQLIAEADPSQPTGEARAAPCARTCAVRAPISTTIATTWTTPPLSPRHCRSARASLRRPARPSSSSACAPQACVGRPKGPASCSACARSRIPSDAGRSSGRRSISLGRSAAVDHIMVRPHPWHGNIALASRWAS